MNMTEDKRPVNGPLKGIRILDLTRLYPGPLGTMMLADMGADVIKIEDPAQPDYVRNFPPFIKTESVAYLAANRSKRSLAVGFKDEDGRKIFFDLIQTADVVVEQFRPGVLDRIGIGYDKASKKNPGIIYISLTGYGQTGPYSNNAGHDLNYIGYAGILASTLSDGSQPAIPGPQVADVAGGAYMLMIACLAALLGRRQTGKGQKVDVSMLDGVLPLMTLQMAQYWAASETFKVQKLPLSGGLASYNTYRCLDGEFIALATLEPKFWDKFCDWIETPDWKEKLYDTGPAGDRLRKELSEVFQTRPRDEWVQGAAEHDICLTPVLNLDEIETDPHLQNRDMFIELSHAQCGNIKGLGVPIKFADTLAGPSNPPPILGQDTFQILQEIGYSEDKIRSLHQNNVILADFNSRKPEGITGN
ncbi:CaiB/BaiF CoA transferase family protein [Thermodesulfobacteriota bacterium]